MALPSNLLDICCIVSGDFDRSHNFYPLVNRSTVFSWTFQGFETFRIKGAELTKMGQFGVKGRYPIHWHMARQINDPTKTYAMDNAIHHVFQRYFRTFPIIYWLFPPRFCYVKKLKCSTCAWYSSKSYLLIQISECNLSCVCAEHFIFLTIWTRL